MAGSIANSWQLVKASARVLQLDRELLIFPVLSGTAAILATVSLVAPLALTGGWEILAREGGSYAAYVAGFLFYLLQYTVVFFFNSALVGAALIRMNGGNPTVGDGLRIAVKRMPAILGYAALAATVGMVLRSLSERAGFLGRMVIGLVGMGWNLATFLTVPVLVTHNVGPIDAVKESADLFRRTWGEQVVGNVGMGWAFTALTLSWTVLLALLVVGAAQLGGAVVLPVLVTGVTGYVVLAVVASALKGIYTAALYRYATEGDAGAFDARVMDRAFRKR